MDLARQTWSFYTITHAHRLSVTIAQDNHSVLHSMWLHPGCDEMYMQVSAYFGYIYLKLRSHDVKCRS